MVNPDNGNFEPEKRSPESPPSRLWTRRGEDDVAYQRQAQVTWWTMLGGIAVGVLLTQFEALLAAVKNGQWYYLLYFFVTCFVIINAWAQTAWGRWCFIGRSVCRHRYLYSWED